MYINNYNQRLHTTLCHNLFGIWRIMALQAIVTMVTPDYYSVEIY